MNEVNIATRVVLLLFHFVPQGQNHIAPVFTGRLSWDGTAKRKVKPKGAAVHWGCDALS